MQQKEFEQLLNDVFSGSRLFEFSGLVKKMTAEQIAATIERADQEWNDKQNAYGLHIRAYMHQNGLGGKENYEKAIELYERVMQQNEVAVVAAAMYNRAHMHENGQGGPVNYQKAIEMYEKVMGQSKAAPVAAAAAMHNRACMHANGQGGPVNHQKAIELVQQVIEKGDVTMSAGNMTAFAHGYQHAEGVNVDYQKVIKLYEQAAALGDVFAMGNLAPLYCYGLGVDRNYGKAIELYKKMIALGSTTVAATAKCNLACLYQNITDGVINYVEAIELYKEAIQKGDTKTVVAAMNGLAKMYYYGKGCPKNEKEAVALYYKAASLSGSEKALGELKKIVKRDSSDLARFKLFLLYFLGSEGVKQDASKAEKYLKNAVIMEGVFSISWMPSSILSLLEAEIKERESKEGSASDSNLQGLRYLLAAEKAPSAISVFFSTIVSFVKNIFSPASVSKVEDLNATRIEMQNVVESDKKAISFSGQSAVFYESNIIETNISETQICVQQAERTSYVS
jgi:TPR repeat protein